MNSYYHINRNTFCAWKIGDEINFGIEDNYMWQSFADKGDHIPLNGKPFDVHLVASHALDTYIRNYPPPREMEGYHFNPLRTLQETLDSLGNSIKVNREVLLETIRKAFYPELPSRQKCVWLIPNNIEALDFWRKVIQSDLQRIFKVDVEGKIHRAAQKWLVGGTFSVNRWNELAHSYWKGEDAGSNEDEILFEGRMRIIDEVIPVHG